LGFIVWPDKAQENQPIRTQLLFRLLAGLRGISAAMKPQPELKDHHGTGDHSL
jgi:hypothetical protein